MYVKIVVIGSQCAKGQAISCSFSCTLKAKED